MHGSLRRSLPTILALALSALLRIVVVAAAQETFPIAHWKFDEPTGDSAIDSATNGIQGQSWER
jgi:hypothetical protein